jgi:hypothetical protein
MLNYISPVAITNKSGFFFDTFCLPVRAGAAAPDHNIWASDTPYGRQPVRDCALTDILMS